MYRASWPHRIPKNTVMRAPGRDWLPFKMDRTSEIVSRGHPQEVAFHARVAEDHPGQPFDIDDVAGGLVDKLVRRHPHVFADVEVSTPEEVAANWQKIKEEEKARRPGAH